MTSGSDSGRSRNQTPSCDSGGRPAVFLDRDGVLNVDVGYAHRPEQIEWIQGAREAVAHLATLGFLVFVVSNQAGVAHGYYDEADVVALHRWMAAELASSGGRVDDWRYCPSHPGGIVEAYTRVDAWRKPEPGMLLDLLRHHDVDVANSFVIGDHDSDVEAARRAGISGHRFDGGDLLHAVTHILAGRRAAATALAGAGA